MQNLLIPSIILSFLILLGCGDTLDTRITGTMRGYVTAIDSSGSSHDKSGVKISFDGTDHFTLSDSSGRWEIRNILPGTYNISFTKDNYAMVKMTDYHFAGDGTDYLYTVQFIYQIMRLKASLVLRPFGNGFAIFSCRVFQNNNPTESLNGAVILLFGKDSLFSIKNNNSYIYKKDNFGFNSADPFVGYTLEIDSSQLVNAGFSQNDTIYCQAFVSNIFFLQEYDPIKKELTFGPSYLDITSGKRIYTGFGDNHSEVKSFILP
jgi:hypothetical protein